MKGELRILNPKGHTTVEWDTEVENGPLDPAVADAEFKRLVSQGHLAYKTDPTTGEHEQITALKPTEHEVVTLTPPMAGG